VVDFIRMSSHGEAAPPPVSGKVVLSRLPAGESTVMSHAPAIKIVIAGEEIHQIDGRTHILRPGRMLLVDRGAPYRAIVRRSHDAMGMCIYLPTETAPDGSAPDPFLGRAMLQTAEANGLGRLLSRSAKMLHRDQNSALSIETLMTDVRSALPIVLAQAADAMERLGAAKPSTRRELLNRLECARAYLHDHKERAIPLDELAGVAAMSSFQFTRYFSLAFGDPPSRYHRKVRLQHAAQKLRRRDSSITEIAFSAGYGELSAFTHAFSREFGCPPSAFVAAPAFAE
jgi:AraC-like DNA-binding protein/quercetin dioxygenase-like cupin family protein